MRENKQIRIIEQKFYNIHDIILNLQIARCFDLFNPIAINYIHCVTGTMQFSYSKSQYNNLMR